MSPPSPPSSHQTYANPQILAIAQYGVLTAAVLNGLGHRARFVTAPRRSTAMRLLFISQVVWYWSITLVKLSVAFLLLRLKQTRRWRSFLYLIMGITISAAIVQTCFQFLQCRPFSVYWDPRVFRSAQCFRRSIINGNIIVFSSIQVGLDVIFSFVPVTFVRKLQRPRREKIFMCVLMGLGLFASCAAVVRTMTLQEFYTSPDMFWLNVKFALWAILELQLALVAATMPTLKAFMERAVVRAGLWFYDEESEGEVRAEMVKLGLLGEGEVLARGEERGPAVGKKATKGMVGAGGGERTIGEMKEGVDTVSGGEVSFEEMLAKSAKEKEFV